MWEAKRQNRGPREVLETALSIFALSASLALAEDFKTITGKEYKNATVMREYEPPPHFPPHLAGRLGFRIG